MPLPGVTSSSPNPSGRPRDTTISNVESRRTATNPPRLRVLVVARSISSCSDRPASMVLPIARRPRSTSPRRASSSDSSDAVRSPSRKAPSRSAARLTSRARSREPRRSRRSGPIASMPSDTGSEANGRPNNRITPTTGSTISSSGRPAMGLPSSLSATRDRPCPGGAESCSSPCFRASRSRPRSSRRQSAVVEHSTRPASSASRALKISPSRAIAPSSRVATSAGSMRGIRRTPGTTSWKSAIPIASGSAVFMEPPRESGS